MGKIKRLAIVIGATGSMFVALFACSSSSNSSGGGGFSCGAKSACANDPARTQSDIDKCNTQLTDPNCGAKYQALDQCTATNQKCGADGKTDGTATLQPCAQQFADALQCGLAHPPADAGGGG